MINPYTHFECQTLDLLLGDKQLFHNFNFSFQGPGIVMIEGENGTGKSSLLKTFAGLIETKKGSIKYSDALIANIPARHFSFFQATSLGLLPSLSGEEHIQLIAKNLELDFKVVEAKKTHFLELELFAEILAKPVADYSQGMKQILRLFLHLFFDPKILFLDEPFLYLSPKIKDFFQKEIEQQAQRSIVFITDQQFAWLPGTSYKKIVLGEK